MNTNLELLITLVAEKTGMTKQDTRKTLVALPETIKEQLQNEGDTVKWYSFLTLENKFKPAYTGNNPSTGEPIDVAERNHVHVRVSKTFRDIK